MYHACGRMNPGLHIRLSQRALYGNPSSPASTRFGPGLTPNSTVLTFIAKEPVSLTYKTPDSSIHD